MNPIVKPFGLRPDSGVQEAAGHKGGKKRRGDIRAQEMREVGGSVGAIATSGGAAEAPEPAAADHPGHIEAQMAILFARHWISPTQRRVARYLMDNPTDGAFLSSVELAARAGVSQATVTRLATSVGFRGYADLQKRLRAIAMSPHPSGPARSRNKLQAAVRAELHNLTALEAALSDSAPVGKIGHQLAASQPLVVMGVRMAAFAAFYFGYFAAKIHPDVRVVTSGGSLGLDQISQARQAGATCLLGFLFPRYPREALRLLEHARSLGMRIILSTDRVPGLASDYADIVLPASVGRRLVFDSHAAVVVLANVLLEAVSDANPSRTQQRLEESERMVIDRDVFVAGHDS
jgi:DNA-binding MurR/RpiR family transcriptional regulator